MSAACRLRASLLPLAVIFDSCASRDIDMQRVVAQDDQRITHITDCHYYNIPTVASSKTTTSSVNACHAK